MNQPKTTLDSFPVEGWYSFIWTTRSEEKLTYGNVDLKTSNSGRRAHLIVKEGVWDCYRKGDTYSLEAIHSVKKVSVLCNEIQKHLPSDHPDKITSKITSHKSMRFVEGTWYKRKGNGWFYLCEKVERSLFKFKNFINTTTEDALVISTLGTIGELHLDFFDPSILADYSIIHKVSLANSIVIENLAKISCWIPPTVEELLYEDIATIATPINNTEGRLIEIDSTAKIPEKWAVEVVRSSDSNSYLELLDWRRTYSTYKCDEWSASGFIDYMGMWCKNKSDLSFDYEANPRTILSIEEFIRDIYIPLKRKEMLESAACEADDAFIDLYSPNLLIGVPGDLGDISDLEFQDVFKLKNTSTYSIDPLINISIKKEKVDTPIFVEPIKNITI